jgi:2-polyprenyl-6-methoxyphenol hydroxylase-like FAD-dependent oxidoreductase
LQAREPVIIIGGGISGLTLALSLHEARVPCRVYEAASELKNLGVGINMMPNAMRELTELGLAERLERVSIATRDMGFYNRFGQFIYREPRGRHAGYAWPQLSIHRGDLHGVLVAAVRELMGADALVLGHRCESLEQNAGGVTVRFTGREPVRGAVAIACDGIHSAVRHQLYPDEGPPAYAGINMWRGTSYWKPYLTGESMCQIGWLDVGKLVVYPMAAPREDGLQLINWTAEIRSARNVMADWNLGGRLEDFLPTYAGWKFDWLDVAGMLSKPNEVLEYPMVDRDPVGRWTHGRITLVGDAAHPMYPRGGNGAAQGILDARALAGCLKREPEPVAALKAYEELRLKAANAVVLAARSAGPDSILQTVHERTGDRPFARIEDVVSAEELSGMMERFKKVAGFEKESLNKRASLA